MIKKPSVRSLARQQGIDIQTLMNILQLRRPDQTRTEQEFVDQYLLPIDGMKEDAFGNQFLTIGENPVVMWSSHTDTVSDVDGHQNIRWSGDTLELNEPKAGQSLGADDGAGIWLMLEMIKAQRPGLYIFHRSEEVGGLGSKWISKNNPGLLEGIKYAIAFDRKATHSVITYQRGGRCCSDDFAQALADKLNLTEGLAYELDEGGVFTDTASYTEQIPECTNLSAGYYNEHTSRETLDVAHLLRLREALLTLDVTDLPAVRDPSVKESRYASRGSYRGYYGDQDYDGYGYGYGYRQPKLHKGTSELEVFVEDHPISVALLLETLGYDKARLQDEVTAAWQKRGLDYSFSQEPEPEETVEIGGQEVSVSSHIEVQCTECAEVYAGSAAELDDIYCTCGCWDFEITHSEEFA